MATDDADDGWMLVPVEHRAAFLSYSREPDSAGRDNRARIQLLAHHLEQRGHDVWIGDDGDSISRRMKASGMAVICVTEAYIRNLGDLDSVCRQEFQHAILKPATKRIVLIMEAELEDRTSWSGPLLTQLGSAIAINMWQDSNLYGLGLSKLVLEIVRCSISANRQQPHRPVKYDTFISHNWSADSSGRDNHARVVKLARGLKQQGLHAWLDEEEMSGDITASMIHGINTSDTVLICVTDEYISKINSGNREDNCWKEFEHTRLTKGRDKMIAVVMEEHLHNTRLWKGPIGEELGQSLYMMMWDDTHLVGDPLKALVKEIKQKQAPRPPQSAFMRRTQSTIGTVPPSSQSRQGFPHSQSVDDVGERRQSHSYLDPATTDADSSPAAGGSQPCFPIDHHDSNQHVRHQSTPMASPLPRSPKIPKQALLNEELGYAACDSAKAAETMATDASAQALCNVEDASKAQAALGKAGFLSQLGLGERLRLAPKTTSSIAEGFSSCVWPDGAKYEGQFANALYHGYGVHVLADGSRYEGQYAVGVPHGYGVYHWANGYRYSGQWEAGHCHGYGVYTWPAWPSQMTYQGQFSRHMRHGAGVFLHGDGAREVGVFAEGEATGLHVYTTGANLRTARSHPLEQDEAAGVPPP